MVNTNLCDVTVILDRSGSMSRIWTDMIGGLNTFLDEQRKVPGDVNFTLVAFDSEITVPYSQVDMRAIYQIDGSQFPPRGSTALLDAMGYTIDTLGTRLANTPEWKRPGKVIVATISDGEENASRKYTWDQVSGKISLQQKEYAWEFLFYGANQDTIATAAKLHIPKNNSVHFLANEKGVEGLSQSFSSSVVRMRTT